MSGINLNKETNSIRVIHRQSSIDLNKKSRSVKVVNRNENIRLVFQRIGNLNLNHTGKIGPKGNPGYTPIKGVDYFDGEKGDDGKPGPQNLFIQDTQPVMSAGSLWIETLDGKVKTFWVEV